MKRCPKCSRTFPDENQKFCTIDGGLLRPDPPSLDPNLTMRATSKELTPPPGTTDSSEAPTSMPLSPMGETIASFGTSTFPESTTGPIGTQTADDLAPHAAAAPTSADLRLPPEAAPTSAGLRLPAEAAPTSVELRPPAQAVSTSANLPPAGTASAPLAQPAAPPKKKSVLPWVIGGVLILLLLLGGGAAAAGYFLWLKPRMEANRRPVVVDRNTTNENSNTAAGRSNTNSADNANANANTNSNANEAAKKETESFVPSAGDVQFANSKATLDGELADHYVGFSFYYPQTWTKDPKAGVPGATSFATVAREFSEKTADYIQERALISWYPSNGTYDGDLPIFPERAKKVTDQISKGLPGYEEVSRGETTVNAYKGYEFRFKGVFKNTGKGDLPYWGRVIFLPPGTADEKNGVTIVMLATSLAPGVTSAGDVGVKGELPLILESFRFGAGR